MKTKAMGKKARLKAIKRIANRFPLVNERTQEKHYYKGSEILSWNTVTEIDGEAIDPDKTYLYSLPVLMIQNTRRRLARAFVKNGIDGVLHEIGRIERLGTQNQ